MNYDYVIYVIVYAFYVYAFPYRFTSITCFPDKIRQRMV